MKCPERRGRDMNKAVVVAALRACGATVRDLGGGSGTPDLVLCQNSDSHGIPKRRPTALGPVANTDTKLLIYGLFQKSRVLAQDGIQVLGQDGHLRRPGPHLDQNVLDPIRRGSPGLDSGPLGRPFFRRCNGPVSDPLPPLAQTWHSKIEIRDENRK